MAWEGGGAVIFDARDFVFRSPPEVARARRVLLKPSAVHPLPHPITTSKETLEAVISGIRQVSDADIILLEGNQEGESVYPIYRSLGYDFPRVHRLDVKDCVWVEVENPLAKPFALPTVWVPNIVLSCDYLISIAPFRILEGSGSFSIENLIGLLPAAKYQGRVLQSLRREDIAADLYFTLPFDLGIIDGRKRLIGEGDLLQGQAEEYGKIFVGEPYEVDLEASKVAGVETRYLRLIGQVREELKF